MILSCNPSTTWVGFFSTPKMDVEPKIGGKLFPPKWMVNIIMENPIKMDDLGVALFLNTPIDTANSLGFVGDWAKWAKHP